MHDYLLALGETNISHLAKRNIIFKSALGGDMLLLRRVVSHESHVSHDSISLLNFPFLFRPKIFREDIKSKLHLSNFVRVFGTPSLVISSYLPPKKSPKILGFLI